MIQAWWVWAVAAGVLAAAEMLAPAQVLLGFAIGAAAMASILGLGGPLAFAIAGSTGATLLTFGLISGAAWLVLRRFVGRGSATVWRDRDVNEIEGADPPARDPSRDEADR